MIRHGAMTRDGGETADKNAVVAGLRRHAKAIAEQCTAAVRALWVAGQNRDLVPARANGIDQLADQRALADARTAGDGDHEGACLDGIEFLVQLRQVLAAGCLREQPGEGPAVAGAKTSPK